MNDYDNLVHNNLKLETANAFPQVKGFTNYGTLIQWKITQHLNK